MTADPPDKGVKEEPKEPTAPQPEPKDTDPKPDRLPDDHPAALALKNANKEAESLRLKLKEYEDRDKSETQKLAERAETAEQRAQQAEQEYLRFKVALEKGLPSKLAARLQGDTEEAMAADADDLLATVGTSQRTPDFDGGARQTAPAAADMNSAIRSRMR